ncbi:MAG: cell division protein FtsW [Nitriliruptoraceae bacterium]|jgi:cell division protein FtsW
MTVTTTRTAAGQADSVSGLRGLLNRLHLQATGPWNKDALALVVLAGLLLALGLLMSLSASFVADARDGDAFTTFQGQLRYAILGLALFAVTASLDHRVWRLLSWLMMLVSLVTLVMVIVPGVGYAQFGATRWLAVGPVIVQPSELAKLSTLLWLADVHQRKRMMARTGELTIRHLLIPALPVFFVQALLVMLEPDLGTTLLLALIVCLVLWLEGIPGRLVGVIAVVGAALTAVAIATAGYRVARITGWLHPEADPLGSGYQLLQSLYALGEGGWSGTGLGASRGKWDFIPNPETDFIFAIIGEELGLIGALTVVALFTGVLVVGLRIARTTPDRFGRLVAGVLTAWLVGQAFINIGTVTGLLPITGVTLPLVSVGGSSLISTLVAFGILTSIARSRPTVAPSRTEAPA